MYLHLHSICLLWVGGYYWWMFYFQECGLAAILYDFVDFKKFVYFYEDSFCSRGIHYSKPEGKKRFIHLPRKSVFTGMVFYCGET